MQKPVPSQLVLHACVQVLHTCPGPQSVFDTQPIPLPVELVVGPLVDEVVDAPPVAVLVDAPPMPEPVDDLLPPPPVGKQYLGAQPAPGVPLPPFRRLLIKPSM